MQPVEQTFTESLQQALDVGPLQPDVQKYLKELAQQQKNDFTSSDGYFSNESKEYFARESAQRLAKALAGGPAGELALSSIQEAWRQIVIDFHHTRYWNQPTQRQKPPKVLTEDQKRTRALFPYIWILFQAWIVMKLVISYFGLEAADSPDETHWFLYFALGFSFCSLCYFAWTRYKKGE